MHFFIQYFNLKLGGKNRHMGDCYPITNLAATLATGRAAEDLLAVLNPTRADRESREGLVSQSSVVIPPHAAWRTSLRIGKVLNPENGHIISSNHFSIDHRRIPSFLYSYHVHMYKVNRDGSVETTDCVSTEEFRNTTALMLALKKKHPEWGVNDPGFGFSYDNKSSLFTTQPLRFPPLSLNNRDEPYVTEIIGLPNADGWFYYYLKTIF
jgi:hypothetical protein